MVSLTGSFWGDLLLILVSAVTAFYFYVSYRQSYFKRKGIPYIEPTFFLGSNYKPFFIMELLEYSLDNMYKELKKHGYGGYYRFLTPSFLVCDPDLIEKILIKDFSHFQDHGIKFDEKVNPLDAHLFNLAGGKWRAMRNKMSPTFTSGKLKWMYPQMEICGDRMAKFLEGVPKGEDYPIREICSRYSMDVIASCAFGLDCDTINDPDSEFRRMGNLAFRPPLVRLLVQIFRFAAPALVTRLKLKTIDPRLEDFFGAITKRGFEHRQKTGQKRNDFIQLLLQLKEKGSVDFDPRDKDEAELEIADDGDLAKLEITDELLTAQCFIFFGAGFEPSASLMSYFLYYMSKKQDIQRRVRNELKEAKAKHGGLNYEAIGSCSYLDACVSETLRIHANNIGLFRECTKDYVMDDGNVIKKGTTLIIPTWSIHMDPDYFPEPTEFKPERFLDNERLRPGIYFPFGEGPRICIARRFALLQAKVGIAKILDNYQVDHSPKNKEPLVRNMRSFTIEPVGGLWVRLRNLP